MNPCSRKRSRLSAITLALLPVAATAQPVASPADSVPDPEEETIILDPFTISAEEGRDSYKVDSTLSGSRIRTDLRNVASSVSVISKAFIEDVGATNSASLLQYTPNAEVAGVRGNFAGGGRNVAASGGILGLNPSTRVRGLADADNTRDFFLTDIPWDSYNSDRVELQRGPNSILFGVGSPAGIVNTMSSGANYKTGGKLETRVSEEGGIRTLVDHNQVLLRQELAVRVMGLVDEEKYQQKPAFRDANRLFAATRWDPAFLKFEGATTSIKANVEYGDIKSNSPRFIPPEDRLTAWWYYMGKRTYNQATQSGAGQPANIADRNSGSTTRDPWIDWDPFIGTSVGLYYNPGAQFPSTVHQLNGFNWGGLGINDAGELVTDQSIGGWRNYSLISVGGFRAASAYNSAKVPGGPLGLTKDRSLRDPSIFDFYNNLIDGESKRERLRFNAYQASITQTLLNNRIALDFTYRNEETKERNETHIANTIGIEVGERPAGDPGDPLIPNPNLGRAYVQADRGSSGGRFTTRERENWRGTLTGELRADDFLEDDSLLTRILGKHNVTGLASSEKFDLQDRNYMLAALDPSFALTVGGPTPKITEDIRAVNQVYYLSGSLRNAASPVGLNLPRLTANWEPPTQLPVRYFNSTWNRSTSPSAANYVDPRAPYSYVDGNGVTQNTTQTENPANYVGWTETNVNVIRAADGRERDLATGGQRSSREISSRTVVLQNYWWDETLVTNFGWRNDVVKGNTTGVDEEGYRNPLTNIAPWDYPYAARNESRVEGNSSSWSVVLHTPQALRKHLPLGSNVSVFVNQSENFKADRSRVDFSGRDISNPKGTTKEYGINISTLNDRLNFRVTKYDTRVENETFGGAFIPNLYFAVWAPGLAAFNAAHIKGRPSNAWIWDYANASDGTPYGNPPADNPTWIKAQAAADDFIKNGLPQAYYDLWNLKIDTAKLRAGDYSGAFLPGVYNSYAFRALETQTSFTIRGMAPSATVDTYSEGHEFELVAQPIPQWNISVNASQTEATRTNFAKAAADFIEAQKKLWDQPAGDLRIWSAGDQTIRQFYNTAVYQPYLFALKTQGESAPEIREWRYNLVSTYSFDEGRFKGFRVGGAWRWQDKPILGYALNAAGDPDITKPWMGKAEQHVDLWFGYRRALTKKIDWDIQLNLFNVGEDDHLVKTDVQPDGSPAGYRINQGMSWQITNRFTF